MATLFALLHSCGRVIKMQKGPRSMRVCKSVCQGISIPLPWAICSQTDPIMFVLQDQIGCVPPASAHTDAPSSQALVLHSFPFNLWLREGFYSLSSIYFGKQIQLSAPDNRSGLMQAIILKRGTQKTEE